MIFDPFGVMLCRLYLVRLGFIRTPKGFNINSTDAPNAFRWMRMPGTIDRRASIIRTPKGFNLNSMQFNTRPNPEGVESIYPDRALSADSGRSDRTKPW